MEVDPTRMCELLVGLRAVNVLGMNDRPMVVLVDRACFGRPARLVWHRHDGAALMATATRARGPGKHDGVDRQRTIQWRDGCRCWATVGEFGSLWVP